MPRGRGKNHYKEMTSEQKKGTLRKLYELIKPYRFTLFLIIIFSVLAIILQIMGPMYLGNAINVIAEGYQKKIQGTGEIDFQQMNNILKVLAGLYVVAAAFRGLQGWLVAEFAQKVSFYLRERISRKVHRLPVSYYDKHSFGDILSTTTNDVDVISMTLNQSLSTLFISIAQLFGILIMMFTISVSMTIVGLLMLPTVWFLSKLIIRFSQKYFRQQQDYLGIVNGKIEEMFTGQEIIRLFEAEEEAYEDFKEDVEILHHSAFRSQFLSGILMPIAFFVSNLSYVAVTLLGGYLVAQGRLGIGNIMSFIQYIRQFSQPISNVAQVGNVFQQTLAAADRVFDFLEAEEEPEPNEKALENARRGVSEQLDPTVRFEHVRFGYTDDEIILKDFSLNVEEGKQVAIVGPTGAGKTTLIKLLMRFYDIQSGRILLDGVNIKDLTRRDLRQHFGMVLQDTWLFSGTIMENIRYGKPDATDEDVINACRLAQIDHFIRTLPNGYHMVISESADNLSEGQKQLLTIARAVLKDPNILILDEATSNVDTRTEKQIQRAMDVLMEGRTSFVIAHRLSTIRDADTILVLNEGDVIETGNHEELMAKKGFYYDLYMSQFAKPEEM